MTGKRALAVGVLLFCLAFTAGGAYLLWPRDDGDSGPAVTISGSEGQVPEQANFEEPLGAKPGPGLPGSVEVREVPGDGEFALEAAAQPYAVTPRLKQPPAAGMLFDVDSGEVLWARRPEAELPIASLTKMMTALMIAEDHRPGETVRIGEKAPGVEGSRVGVLKAGTEVPLRGLFLGLIMVSGNDAAVALAEHDAGTVDAFVRKMNRRAGLLGLNCTHFAGPAGLQDRGNHSCAYDLAALARADLSDPWIASVTSRASAEVPFPTKGGKLSLANNHYFVHAGIAGVPGAQVTGVKTGLTNGAGRCYVTTARLGDHHLGVVLLDSPDPIRQVPQLLRAGFEAEGALLAPASKRSGKRSPAD